MLNRSQISPKQPQQRAWFKGKINLQNSNLQNKFLKKWHKIRIKIKLKKMLHSAFKPQVPDDDFHDNGEELSEEDIPLPTEKSTSVKSSRYFYRNNQRFSVNNAEMENIDDYKAFGKDGSRLRRMNLMKQNDFLEIKGVNGPILKNRITWVNMMRANRGWYPKRSAE